MGGWLDGRRGPSTGPSRARLARWSASWSMATREQAGDVEPAVRRVGPEARPAGLVERPDGRDGDGSRGGEGGQDLLERHASSKPGARPGSVHVQCGSSSAATRARRDSPDLALDRDEVADDLGRAPFAVGDRAPLRDARRAAAASRAGNAANVSTSSALLTRPGVLVDEVRGQPALRLVERRSPLRRGVVGQLVATDPADPEVVAGRVPQVVAGHRRRPATSRTTRSAGCRPATPPRAGRRASPSRCGPGRPGSPGAGRMPW